MLTDAELAAIRTRLALYHRAGLSSGTDEDWREIAGEYYEVVPALLAEVERLRAENARRREDIGWLYAQMAGKPRLTEGEMAHQWTTGEDYANRYITDYGTEAEPAPLAPDEHKLRRVKCATCGQFWTHP